MKRPLFLALCLLAFSARAGAQATSTPAEHLCISDSISVSRGPDNLVEGLRNVSLAWNASTSNPDWYNVYRGPLNGALTQITTCVKSTSYVDLNVPTGQIYYYAVTAVLAGLESTDSNQAQAAIPVLDSISVIPNWQGLPSEMLTTSDGLAIAQVFHRAPAESLAESSFVDLSVTSPTSSNLSLYLSTSEAIGNSQVLGRSANESLSSTDAVEASKSSIQPGQLGAPFRLSVTATAQPPQVILHWAQSVSPGLVGSNVYRHAQQGGPYYLLTPLARPATFFTDLTVTGAQQYCYVVTAVTPTKESPYSNEACSTPPGGVSPPFRLSATIRLGSPFLTWTQSATRGLTQNNLYRSTTHGGPYTVIASFAPTGFATDATAVSGQTYFYVVTALVNGLESSYSNEVATTVP